ncbi:Protein phosphatase PTC7 [Entomortierella chlamydospora]|uniref:Protein phosphatase n=1 Tax=Entomortierella chlamydospora TaxID=101097 RepID=A0A9P6T2L7_9FUNG|nr:Protein phosphatase PTC7 [Entomortierella chlamydospora]
MLGRNAARPLGMTPSRLVAAYNAVNPHRLTQWVLTRPYTMMHMRLLFLTQQLLITNLPNSASSNSNGSPNSHGIPTPTLASLDASSACQLHTSTNTPALCQAQEIVLPSDLYTPPHNGSAAATEATAAAADATPSSTSVATDNAIAFNYLLAASWHPKSRQRQQLQKQQQQVLEDAANAERTLRWKQKLREAHPGKVDAGEDAFFHVSTPSRVALGVADGVGGWSEMGVDPSLFSWALMNNAEHIARSTDNLQDTTEALSAGSDRKALDAQTILDGAYSELVQSGKIEAGSSTACILSLCKLTGTLKASNLGDSAFLLIRDNKCIYESPSQQHFWNCPYQLTVLPPKLRQQQQDSGNSNVSEDGRQKTKTKTATAATTKKKAYVQDLPKDAVQTTHQLQDGDVIVLATDGFWDNVFTKEAIELVDRELGDIIREQQQQGSESPISPLDKAAGAVMTMTADEILARVRALSKRLTNTARRFSLDSKRMTPFSQGARHIQCGG